MRFPLLRFWQRGMFALAGVLVVASFIAFVPSGRAGQAPLCKQDGQVCAANADCCSQNCNNTCIAAPLQLPQRGLILVSGPRLSLPQIILNLTSFLAVTIVSVCGVIFLLGACYWVMAAGRQDWVDSGKKHMIGALTGLAVTLGSYAILRTVYYFLYI